MPEEVRRVSISQAGLAETAYFRHSFDCRSVAGNRAISTKDLLYLCLALDKPVEYFFPPRVARELTPGTISPLLQELIIQARQLNTDNLRKVIAQVKAIASLSPFRDGTKSNDYRNVAEVLDLKPDKKRRKTK